MAVISAHGLVKRFGSTTALDGLDLRVEAGEVHGFLGPNGAGKSTTIRILLGLLRPHAGTVRLPGGDPWDEAPELHRRLAYVPGDVSLWPTLTGGEVIDLLGRLNGGIDPRRRDALLERFDLDASRRARTYSRGNRQKVALVAALASDAELLLLDEPTSGLDPLMEVEFRAAVREDRTRGRTVLLSSHVLSEVEQICDRVTIIRAGRTVETGSLTELRHLNRTQVTAELAGPVPPRPRDDPRRPRRRRRRRTQRRLGRVHRPHHPAGPVRRGRGPVADEPPADPRAALPPPLRGRARAAMTGVAVLARLAVRRSRWFWLAWIAALAVVSPLTALASDQILPPGPQRDQLLAVLSSTGALQALTGPAVSLDGPGGVTVWRAGTMLATLAGVMAVLGVVRTTRGDEEAGRTELVRSGSVGRHAPTAAAVLVALGGGIVLGLLVVLGMVAAGTPVAGSVAYGAGLAGTSAVFVGVGAVASQLAGSARAAKGLGLAVVGTSYLARAVSDGTATSPGTSNLLSWLSPVGWTALAHPYAGERWWVLALPALTTAVLLAGAVILEGRRDHGSGFWTSGPGGRQAGPTLSHPRGLALRLHRAGIAAWAVGVSAWALLMGLLCTGFTEVMGASRELGVMMRRLGAGARDPAEAFVLAQLALIALVVAVSGVQLLTRLRQEETDGRADLVLATRVRRTVLAWSHLGPALLVPSVLLVGAGVLLALPGAVEQADPARVRDLAAAATALLPGVWLVVGLGFALHGWVPTAFAVVWFVIGWAFFVSWLGAVLDLPRWLIRLTPLGPLPRLPQEQMAWGPVLGVSALTLACLAAGLAGYRRRDLLTG